MSERGIDSGQTTPDNLADTGEIKCICDVVDDDGCTMIQCDNCYTWQHIDCVRADPDKEYKCYNCSDIRVEKSLKDSKKNKKDQKVRNEAESRIYSPVSQVGELNTTSANKSRNIPSSSSYSRDFKIIDKNIISSKAVEELFPKVYSQYQAQHRKRSMSLSSTPKTDNEHNRDDNQESSVIRSTSPSLDIGNPFMMEKESLARPLMKTIVKPINQSRSKMHKKHSNCYGLFAETIISSGLFIVEFKGEICLKSDYKANESNQYSLLGVTQPFVLFYPVLNLCVDARRNGTEARFIRRSCHPNAETRTIVVPGFDEQQVHLGIFAKSDISKGKEITIGWDWEPNHITSILTQDSIFENEDDKKRDEIGKIAEAVLRLTECACENKDNCMIYKIQNDGKALGKPRKKRVTDVEEETSPGANEEDYEDDMDIVIPGSAPKKLGYMRKINRRGKQSAERLSESSLNGNNKDKKKAKEIDNTAQPNQKNRGKEPANRFREETENIRRKSRKSENLVSNKHARSSSSKTDGLKRRLHEDDEGQHSESSLSSVNSEMSNDDDFPGTSIEVTSPSRNNVDKNNPDEQINRESNEDRLSVSYDPPVNYSIETPGINDITQSSTNLPRPLPPAISGIPFKDYLILMHEWKKAIEAAAASTSTEDDDNPSLSALHESNVEMSSEYIEPGRYKGLNSNSSEIETDPAIDKDARIDPDEELVPLPTPIIPAKRVASSPSPTLNNSNGKASYNENGSDVKGKRQKTEELQNLSKGKGREIEIENEGTKFSQNNNMQSSDNRDSFENPNSIKPSGDLKKQAINPSSTYSSANEISKTTTSKPKISLDEYRSQMATASLNKEKKLVTEDSKSPISSVTENDKKDKTVENNDGMPTVNTSTKARLSLKEPQDKSGLTESSSSDVLKKSTDLVSNTIEQKSDVIVNKQINEQAKPDNSTVVEIPPKSPKSPRSPPPKTSTAEDNNITSHSSLINDGYFPEVDFPPGFSSKDIDSFNTNDYGRHTNSNHSDGSYEETRGRHSPSYKDYPSIKSSSNYNSSYNIPLCDTPMQTSPRPEHMSPPRGPRYYSGHFRGNRMGGPYRGMSMSPGDRGRYHGGSYFNSAGSLPATPRQGAQSSMMSSSASSPYDPANPDGQSSNIPNERDPALDNSNIVGNNSGGGITMESKARDYARPGGERSDVRERWNYGNNYFAREREWRERDRDDGRKDWNNKRLDHHYREREGYPLIPTRRPSSGPHQDRYTMIGGSGMVPTGPAAGLNPSPSGISKSNEQSSSSNNPSQRFGVDDHRRNRR